MRIGYKVAIRELHNGTTLNRVVDANGQPISANTTLDNCHKLIMILEIHEIKTSNDWQKLPCKIRKAYRLDFSDLEPLLRLI